MNCVRPTRRAALRTLLAAPAVAGAQTAPPPGPVSGQNPKQGSHNQTGAPGSTRGGPQAGTAGGATRAQVFSLAYAPDGATVAVGGFREVRLLDGAGKLTASLPGHKEVVRALAFSRDGKLLAAAGGVPGRAGEVKLWDVATRQELKTFAAHKDCVYGLAFAPDGTWIATSSYDKLIKLWDPAAGTEIRTLKDHIDAVYAVGVTPDGARLVSAAADRTVKVWSPATGERLYTMGEASDGLNALALDPQGKRVAAGGLDKTLRVWTLGEKGGTLANSLIAHEDAILHVAWSPDGRTLASAAADRTVKLFRADDLTEIRNLDRQPDWVYSVEFSPDGGHLAAGRYDGSVTFYDLRDSQRAAR